jgi:RNA polymerase sigma-70 factor, ECF subfamily
MSDPDPNQDRQLWLKVLVERYERPLLAYATRLLNGNGELAQDVVQETLLRLCRADAERIAPRIPAWLFTVCRTRVIDMRRTEHAVSAEAEGVAANEPTPNEVLEKQETQAQIQVFVNRLPARQQELLHLRLQSGLSYQEIAETTGMTVSNVGYQLHVAIRTLRDAMTAADRVSMRPAP